MEPFYHAVLLQQETAGGLRSSDLAIFLLILLLVALGFLLWWWRAWPKKMERPATQLLIDRHFRWTDYAHPEVIQRGAINAVLGFGGFHPVDELPEGISQLESLWVERVADQLSIHMGYGGEMWVFGGLPRQSTRLFYDVLYRLDPARPAPREIEGWTARPIDTMARPTGLSVDR